MSSQDGSYDLSQSPLPSPPQNVQPFSYPKKELGGGIVHLGFGCFHRAHLANYTHLLMEKDYKTNQSIDKTKGWGIVGVGMTKYDGRMRDAMTAQNCVYTLLEKEENEGQKSEDNVKIVGSIKEYVFLGDENDRQKKKDFVQRLGSDTNIRIVSMTVTQAGYILTSPPELNLDFNHPSIKRDLGDSEAPTTLAGVLCEALRIRKELSLPPFTVLSCDNIQHNGLIAKKIVLQYAERVHGEKLKEWITSEVKFPNCMVDRITPRTKDEDMVYIKNNYSIVDQYPVVCEKFIQFVVEDDFSQGRPAWEEVGVMFVDDVTPYEMMKLRLLNASHCAMAVIGDLIGFKFIDEVMMDSTVSRYIRALMDREFQPTLLPVDIDLEEYKDSLMKRFTNQAIKDQIQRVADDALLTAILHTISDIRNKEEFKEKNISFKLCAVAVAAWIRRAGGGKNDQGDDIKFVSPNQEEVQKAALSGGSDPRKVLQIESIFGKLGEDKQVVEQIEFYLKRFYSTPAREVMEEAAKNLEF